MTRLALVFSSILLLLAWSAPTDAETQNRARRRGSSASQGQRSQGRSPSRAASPQRRAPSRARAPQRSSPGRAPAARAQRGRSNGGSQQPRANRRAPRRDGPDVGRAGNANAQPPRGGNRAVARRSPAGATATGNRSGRNGTRVISPRGNSAPGVGRQGGRGQGGPDGRRAGTGVRAGGGPAGNTRIAGGRANRQPRNGNVVGSAVRRSALRSRPIIVNNNYDNGGRRGGRGYTPYRGRHNYGRQHIYGSYFYFPGYSTFNIGIGYGSGYRYDPYWHGSYGNSYGYSAYAYQSYGNNYYTGSLRLKVQPRFGEVFVDGYYVGVVNDYDGIFQRLRLEEGPHHIEIIETGFVPLEFDVLILPGETITYEGYLSPL